jgi:hypothetical protein
MGYAYLVYTYLVGSGHSALGCPVQSITSYPCPSCGITRSVIAILHGEFGLAAQYNLLGFLVLSALVAIPVLILKDFWLGTRIYTTFYLKTEAFLKRWYVAVPLVAMIVVIWVNNMLDVL